MSDPRDVIARELAGWMEGDPNHTLLEQAAAEAVLAALDAAGLEVTEKTSQCLYCGDYLDDGCPTHGGDVTETRDDQWEWNVREQWGALLLNEWVPEEEARGWLQSKFPRTLVRRRPAGAGEVAS